MSCDCQVKDRDHDKPCPVCGDDPSQRFFKQGETPGDRESQRLRTLGMMLPRTVPRKEPQ